MNKKKEKLFERRNRMHHLYAVEPDPINEYIKDLEKILKHKARNNIRDLYTKKVTKHEKELIDDILGVMTSPLDIAHFLLGGHIQLVGDNALMYEKWSKNFGPTIGTDGKEISGPRKKRISSHFSVSQQYAVSGPIVKEALFGTRLVDPNNVEGPRYTWIQLEGNPVGGFKEFVKAPVTFLVNVILHMINYFDYKITKRNIGPHGKSNYTEANPLKIDVSNVTPELAVERASLWKEIIFNRLGDIRGLEDKMILAGFDVPDNLKSIPAPGA